MLDFEEKTTYVKDTSNGSLCFYETNFQPTNYTYLDTFTCRVNHTDIANCDLKFGNHAKTFWSYFVLRLVFDITMNSVFALFDGSALKLAKEHDSDYSNMALFLQIGAALGSLSSGFLVQDEEGMQYNGSEVWTHFKSP